MELTNEQCALPARELEIEARAEGRFDAAVAYQLQADLIEATGDFLPFCSWFQRGNERNPIYWVHDGMLGLESRIGGTIMWLTRDVAFEVLQHLMEEFGWAPKDEDWRMLIETTPRDAPFSKKIDKLLAESPDE